MPSRIVPTKTRLIETAARLFRARGYHGVGLIELLKEARAPKGSMYHAFPAGKTDLALAAADHASMDMLAGIHAAFEPADDWGEGLRRLCAGLADGPLTGPVTPMLFDGPDNTAFTDRQADHFGRWTRALAYHAIRLGEDEDTAEARAEMVVLALEGAFVLARARGDAAILRDLPDRLGL